MNCYLNFDHMTVMSDVISINEVIIGTIFDFQTTYCIQTMDIRQYFKAKSFDLEAVLLASTSVSKFTICAVEKELNELSIDATSKRGSYIKLSGKEMAKIGGYAAKFGLLMHFNTSSRAIQI